MPVGFGAALARIPIDNARAYAAQHPKRCRVVADGQLTDPGVLARACTALAAAPRGGEPQHATPRHA
ncbi:hypothetical protein [Streptomyces sp. NPDC006267]|uniref:hypothetical protein n=1 Tax=Streptomyces sp. NPDC006267 TaxID=3157173 RepID=UPI0033BFA730